MPLETDIDEIPIYLGFLFFLEEIRLNGNNVVYDLPASFGYDGSGQDHAAQDRFLKLCREHAFGKLSPIEVAQYAFDVSRAYHARQAYHGERANQRLSAEMAARQHLINGLQGLLQQQ